MLWCTNSACKCTNSACCGVPVRLGSHAPDQEEGLSQPVGRHPPHLQHTACSLLYTLYCLLWNEYCMCYSVILYALYIIHLLCVLCNYAVCCSVSNPRVSENYFRLYTVFCILCKIYSILYTVYCILYTVYFILYNVYCKLLTVYCFKLEIS